MASLAEARSHNVDRATFLDHHTAIAEAKRQQQEASAALARTKKSAKEAGIQMKAYKFCEDFAKLDEDEQEIVWDRMIRYRGFRDLKFGTQTSLLDAPKAPKRKPPQSVEYAVSMAEEAGLRAGREGELSTENPYVPGTDLHEAWHEKHGQGLAERLTAQNMTSEESAAEPTAEPAPAPTRRGRSSRTADAMDSARSHLTGDRSTLN